MKNEMKVILVLLIIIGIIFILINNNTMAMEDINYINTTIIENNNDNKILYNNIYNFIDKKDDLLIALSSYELSNTLSQNYDFLKKFAINYIIDNKEYYSDKIKDNKIDINEVYKITNNIFGIDYFYISDEEAIELIKDDRRFNMKIKSLDINKNNNYVEVIADYSSLKYKYILFIKEDRLVINNIEVLS